MLLNYRLILCVRFNQKCLPSVVSSTNNCDQNYVSNDEYKKEATKCDYNASVCCTWGFSWKRERERRFENCTRYWQFLTFKRKRPRKREVYLNKLLSGTLLRIKIWGSGCALWRQCGEPFCDDEPMLRPCSGVQCSLGQIRLVAYCELRAKKKWKGDADGKIRSNC